MAPLTVFFVATGTSDCRRSVAGVIFCILGSYIGGGARVRDLHVRIERTRAGMSVGYMLSGGVI